MDKDVDSAVGTIVRYARTRACTDDEIRAAVERALELPWTPQLKDRGPDPRPAA